jgi:single-strand DNA-binding protein
MEHRLMSSTDIVLYGRLTEDPSLRFTPSGKPVASFRVLTSRSRKNDQTNEWENLDTTGWNCSAWDRLAENLCESLAKGDPVIVTGRAYQRQYETRDGGKGYSLDVQVTSVGPDLRYAQARTHRPQRNDAAPQQQRQQQRPAANDDPWASSAQPVNDPWSTPVNDEPPF